MEHFDIVIIGTGAGGATLATRLADSGKKILLLERGSYLNRETENWDPRAVFINSRYLSKETWLDKNGKSFHPGIHYYVGGNTKVYGAVLFRFREQDFGEIQHIGGISPAWPIGYDAFEPYYTQAEQLFHVHGQRGEDPTEPPMTENYRYPAITHEPVIAELSKHLQAQGLHPFHLPVGVLLNETNGRVARDSTCIKCGAFDGYPCAVNGKSDTEVICIHPLMKKSNVTLLTKAYVSNLETDASGKQVKFAIVEVAGERIKISADIFVVSCGAVNSAALLLRSASDKHPNGLANSSDMVGRHYMRHNNSVLMALSKNVNTTVFQKTLGINDYYLRTKENPEPLGHIQMLGKTYGATLKGSAPPVIKHFPESIFSMMTRHSVDYWLTSEDLPDPANRVTLTKDKQVQLSLTPNNLEAHYRLIKKAKHILKQSTPTFFLSKMIPIEGTAHQCGTLKFGRDAKTSVLDIHCKTHDVDNLYVVDSSFFVSSSAVNPTLTIIANALRVGDHINERIK